MENGMSMLLQRKRKMSFYRVLAKNVAIPMINNHQESPFCAIIDVPQRSPCGQVHQQLQHNFRHPPPTSSVTKAEVYPGTMTMQLLWECQLSIPNPKRSLNMIKKKQDRSASDVAQVKRGILSQSTIHRSIIQRQMTTQRRSPVGRTWSSFLRSVRVPMGIVS